MDLASKIRSFPISVQPRITALLLSLVLLMSLALACGSGADADDHQELLINLPADEGAHPAGIEWWYFNGHLADDRARDYSFHFVTFQIGAKQDGGDVSQAGQLAQLSWGDHTKDIFVTGEKVSLKMPDATPGSFQFDLSGWQMSGDGQDYALAFNTSGYSVSLTGLSTKPAAFHQKTGFVNLGPAGDTFYYTRPRLELSGTLTVDGISRPVNGTGWMDHQWGEFVSRQVGWDWMSLQMDDGSELMAVLVWDPEGHLPFTSYGTFIAPDGKVRHLLEREVSLTPTGSWTSQSTNVVYPMGWELRVEPLALELVLTPKQQNAEIPKSRYGPPGYWEGAVSLTGVLDGTPITGMGFVELVGYRGE
ncbi:MAG: hypothetical protein BZY75_06610 [SAR202 cluster bacterium Io17-Chloro-G7]|nr:MAG: hypothetical protein BZY75_06610 [SAR202 cluster bacterium Io17-Chloro-G7]